jgi:WD40 repeat protein
VGEIEIVDLETKGRLHLLPGPPEVVYRLAFSPDGKRLLSTGRGGGRGIMWNVEAGQKIYEFEQGDNLFDGMFSADGGQILTASSKAPRLVLRNAADGETIRELVSPKLAAVVAARFSADGKRIVAATTANEIPIYEADTGKRVQTLATPTGTQDVRFWNGDRCVIASGMDNVLRIFEIQSSKMLAELPLKRPVGRHLALSPDGTLLATGGGVSKKSLADHQANRQGESSRDYDVQLWRLPESLEPRPSLEADPIEQVHRLSGHGGSICDLEFLDDGRLVSVGDGAEVRTWDAREGRQIDVLAGHTEKAPVYRVAASPAAGMFATGDEAGKFLLWNGQGSRVGEIQAPTTGCQALALSPDGSRLFTVGEGDWLPRIWNTKTRQVERVLDAKGRQFRAAAFTPDGKLLVTGGNNGMVYAWDTRNGEQVAAMEAGQGALCLAVAADNRTIAVGGFSSVTVVDLQEQKRTHRLEGHTAVVQTVAFLPDGRHVVSGSDDKTWRVWSLAGEREVARVTGDKHYTSRLAVSPDGTLIAGGCGRFLDEATKSFPTDGDFDIRVWKLPESLWPESRDARNRK